MTTKTKAIIWTALAGFALWLFAQATAWFYGGKAAATWVAGYSGVTICAVIIMVIMTVLMSEL